MVPEELILQGSNESMKDLDLVAKEAWRSHFKGVPLLVHDIWLDIVERKGMKDWSVWFDPISREYFLLGKISERTMNDGKRNKRIDRTNTQPVEWIAILCHDDVTPFDFSILSSLRQKIMCIPGQQSIRNIYLALVTISPRSISYYRMHDCIAT